MTTTTSRRRISGPVEPDGGWRSPLAYAWGIIDTEIADDLDQHPPTLGKYHTVMAEYAALRRYAEHRLAECVAYARRNVHANRWSWEDLAGEIGMTAREAERLFGKIPPPPFLSAEHHADGCDVLSVHLRPDRKGWYCPCGAIGNKTKRQAATAS